MGKWSINPGKYITICSVIFLLFGLYLSSLYSYLLFQSLVEILSIVIAYGIFMIVWNARKYLDNNYLLFLGIAYLFVGTLDLALILAYNDLSIFPGYKTNISTQLWIAGRYMESISLLIAPFLIGRKMKIKVVFLCYITFISFILLSIFYWSIFPDGFIEGVESTWFKNLSEYIISLILLGSLILLLQNQKEFDGFVLQLLAWSILATIASELAFTFNISAYGFSNLVGHLLKIISFYLIYKAIFRTKPYNILFRDLKQSDQVRLKAPEEFEQRFDPPTNELIRENEQMRLENKELKRAEEALQQSELQYRSLFDNAGDAIFIHDLSGEILKANQVACERLGYSQEELSQMDLIEISPSEYRDLIRERMNELRQAGHVIFETEQLTQEGKKILTEFNCRIIEYSGNLTVQSIVRDISNRKHLERQLLASQKMEAIGRLTGGVAHDFNNLLTTIIGNAQMSLMSLSKDDPLREEIEEIKKAGDQAASLTRQLLAFSRRQIMQPRVLNLNTIINEMEKMIRRLIGENIQVEKILSPDLGDIEADPAQIEQIIMNLSVNARDAMPDGGQLTIETTNSNLDIDYAQKHEVELQTGPYVLLSITDTGIGIDKEVQTHIFEPFFSTKGVGKGTGLGLATIYGIIKQSKGYIWVYSEPGIGTTFKIYLPRVKKTTKFAEEKHEVPSKNFDGSETIILLVEDDPMVRSLTRKSLEKYGCHVLEAQTGNEALWVSVHHTGKIHLLVTDVVMPGMNGPELWENLMPMRPEMKVLFMSGYTDNVIAHHGLLDKRAVLIQKPFTSEELVHKMQQVIDSQTQDKPTRSINELNKKGISYLNRLTIKNGATQPSFKYHGKKTDIKVLVVDDEEPIRRLLGHLLEGSGYKCVLASDSAEARKHVRNNNFHLVLCDVNLPGESGLDFARYVVNAYPETALVMISAIEDQRITDIALEIGTYGYIVKPFRPIDVIINITNALKRRKLEIENRLHRENLEKIVQERTYALQNTLEDLKRAMDGIVQAIALTVETRDAYTAGHQQRVADLARAIAIEMGLSMEQVEGIHIAGMIHDLGKISVPSQILSKPTLLSALEFEMIKTHPQIGYNILRNIDFPWPIAQIVYEHHERIDGSGYPQRLRGENLLIESTIISVADVVEAMASHRPYRPALGINKALEEITQSKGVLYNPDAVDACLRLFTIKSFKFKLEQ